MNETTTSLQNYLDTIKDIPLLSKEEFINLAKKYSEGSESAKAKIVRHNLRLVIKFSKGYAKNEDHMMDLIQEGNLGLIRAVEKFDLSKKGENGESYAFSTYAESWIRYRVEKFLYDNQSIIKVPLHMMKLTRKVYKLYEQAQNENVPFNVSDVAKKLDKKESAIKAALNIMQSETSMNTEISSDGEKSTEFGETLADENQKDENEVASTNRWLYLQVERLPQNQKDAIIHMFGLYNTPAKNGEETGKIMGLSRERVRQLTVEAKKNIIRAANREGVCLEDLVL